MREHQLSRLFVGISVALGISLGACSSPEVPDVDSESAGVELVPCRFQAFDEFLAAAEPDDQLPVGPEAGEAQCGSLEVWENRETETGRRISLNIVVLPATGEEPVGDPLFLFAGGPGSSVTSWGWVPMVYSGIRERRDLVLVDQRGTGGSNPLACAPEGTDDNLQGFIDPMLSPEWVEACRTKLETVADLTRYTTLDAADDIEEVRLALGYERINLLGRSYGTRPVQVYARRHPDGVRTATIGGVVTMSFEYPLHHSEAGQRALDKVFAACAEDPECARAYPDPAGDLEMLLERFRAGPVEIEIDHPRRDERLAVRLDGDVLAERFRSLMYRAHGSVQIPRLLREAVSTGDLEELAETTLDYQMSYGEGVDWFSGMWLSVVCSEDVYMIDDREVAEATAGTVFGDYRVRVLREACESWPRREMPEGYHETVRSEAPFLVMSGDLDPVTPPWGGEVAVAELPNGIHLIAQEGHGSTDVACSLGVFEAFLDAGTIDGLDANCLAAVALPPWELGE